MPSALPKPSPAPRPHLAQRAEDELMTDPLHPMHQDLLARFAAPPVAEKQWAVPTRMAVAFYAAAGAWVLVWLAYRGGIQML